MKKTLNLVSAFGLVTLFLLLIVTNIAQASDRTVRRNPEPAGLSKPTGAPANTMININNITGWISNNGKSALNPSTAQAGVYFPRGTTTCLFQDGIVWGGNVNDGGSQLLRVGGQTYSIGTQGGRIISAGVAVAPDAPDVRVYRIRRDYKTADLRQDASELQNKALTAVTDGEIAAVRDQYARDWQEWPADQGAPFYDKNGDGKYDPNVDEPGVADADQVIWFVCNDLNPGLTNALYGSNPIGMELQVTIWGYNRTDPLANVYFKKFTFIYKGTATTAPNSTITEMYACQWSDPDLGDPGNDFAGCDTSLSLVYVYNGEPTDSWYAAYGLNPPAVGYDFLQGPIVAGAPTDSAVFGLKRVYGKKNLPMTAAFYFAAGGTYQDPPFTRDGTNQFYNLMRGLTPLSGTPFVHPNFPGEPTRFWLDGDPVNATGRVDGIIESPGDRRIGACTGPFTMALGDTQEIVVGVVAGIGTSYLSSITIMKNNDIAVQNAYNDLFNLPKAPPGPKVSGIGLDREVVLDWGSDFAAVRATEDFNRKGYTFQGYNVYQLPSVTASFPQAIKIATYDVVDGVRTIYDDVFDVTLGIITRVIKQTGTDNGIHRFMGLTQDRVRTQPFVNGQRYFFAVTAYGYNPDPTALTGALESSLEILTVIPQVPTPGTRFYAPFGDTLAVTNTNPGKKSDGVVQSIVVDPNKLTGKNYKMTFKNVETTFIYAPGDTIVAPILNWYLVRGGTDTVARGVNQGPTVTIDPGDGDVFGPRNGNLFDYPTVDGMFVTVSGPPPLINGPRTSFTGTEWWTNGSDVDDPFPTANNPGGRKLRYQATTAFDMTNYFGAVGSTLDASQYVDIEFRFGDGGSLTQKAYRMNRAASAIETGTQYKFLDYSDVPFQVYDISNPASPRQLNVGYRDQDASGHWEPSGATEPIFVAKSTYDGATPKTYGSTVGSSANNLVRQDVMFVAEWISDNLVESDIKASTIRISPNYVNAASDVFVFDAPAAPTFDKVTAKADVSAINVFPNPYYGFNRAETTRFNRFVRFSHLPQKADVRIFNLAGVLVRSIAKDDPTQFLNWDLNNQNGLPVASGLYIAYINMPDVGATKTLKLIVIMEQQYLDNF